MKSIEFNREIAIKLDKILNHLFPEYDEKYVTMEAVCYFVKNGNIRTVNWYEAIMVDIPNNLPDPDLARSWVAHYIGNGKLHPVEYLFLLCFPDGKTK